VVATGLVTTLRISNPLLGPHDLVVATEGDSFSPARLAAPAGEVSVFVDNGDAARHTFTMDALGVDLEVPAGHNARVTFSAPPGAYEYFCSVPGHEDMRGTLVAGA
jgi:plastocyanin